MLRRYELTDEERNRIAPLLPPENSGKQGRPKSAAGQFWKELFGLLVAELHGETFQNVMVPGKLFIPISVNGLKTAPLIIFFVFWA